MDQSDRCNLSRKLGTPCCLTIIMSRCHNQAAYTIVITECMDDQHVWLEFTPYMQRDPSVSLPSQSPECPTQEMLTVRHKICLCSALIGRGHCSSIGTDTSTSVRFNLEYESRRRAVAYTSSPEQQHRILIHA